MAAPTPLPRTQDPLDEAFWRHCQQGELRFQRCTQCGGWRFLPRYMCAKCGSPEFAWSPASGGGTLFSWTVVHQAMHPAFAADVPYVAAVVELDEGVRMATRLTGCDRASLKLGLRLKLVFREIGEGFQLPCFEPAEGAQAERGAAASTEVSSWT